MAVPAEGPHYLVPVVPTRTGVPGRMLRFLVAVLAAVAGALLLGTGPAHAQVADLQSTSPEDGAELESPPTQVVLTFDGPVGDSTVTMACAGDPFVPPNTGAVVRSADGRTLTVPILVPMPASECNVTWSTLQPSGEDGAEGSFGFTVLNSTTPSPDDTTPGSSGSTPTGGERAGIHDRTVDGRGQRRRCHLVHRAGRVGRLGRGDLARPGAVDPRAGDPVRVVRPDRRGLAGGAGVHPRRPVPAVGVAAHARRDAALRHRPERGRQRRLARQRAQPRHVARPPRCRLGRPRRDRPARARGRHGVGRAAPGAGDRSDDPAAGDRHPDARRRDDRPRPHGRRPGRHRGAGRHRARHRHGDLVRRRRVAGPRRPRRAGRGGPRAGGARLRPHLGDRHRLHDRQWPRPALPARRRLAVQRSATAA